jgi:hypothetical protein
MRTSQMFDGHAGEPPKREGLTSANYRQHPDAIPLTANRRLHGSTGKERQALRKSFDRVLPNHSQLDPDDHSN